MRGACCLEALPGDEVYHAHDMGEHAWRNTLQGGVVSGCQSGGLLRLTTRLGRRRGTLTGAEVVEEGLQTPGLVPPRPYARTD